MATTYNNLDDYLRNQEPIDSALLNQIEANSDFHKWNKDDFKVFKDSVNGYFHIPKDIIIKTEKTVGSITTTIGCKASEDAILKSTSAPISRSAIAALYTANATIKFYNFQTPSDQAYLTYKNFDSGFNYQQTYSVAAYPWIKTGNYSYRDRMGDWDLNGNTSVSNDSTQGLCRTLKQGYKINDDAVWPETYRKYTPSNNTWTTFKPELTTNPNVEEIDSNDNRINPQTVWKWPQRDYLFDNKYITSCDIEPVIGTASAPYQFSDKYLTKFAQTKPADPESRKVEKLGFTSVKSLGKILQKPVETFNDSSIKFLEISWTNPDTKTECNITASYDDTASIHWTQIPKDRTLGMRIRLPGSDWKYYDEERLKRPRDHRPPIQLPWGQYIPSDNTIQLYGAGSGGTVHDWQKTYDWTWEDCRQNEPWYSNDHDGSFAIQSISTGGVKYIPQLKINFSNKYYYVSTTLEKLFEGRGNVNSITILLYTGKFEASMWGDRIIFDCSDGGHVVFQIKTTAKEAGKQWGWNVKTLYHSGSMDDWDRELIYLASGQTEFNDFYNINGRSDSDFYTLSGSLHIFNNIDLFGSVETITDTDSFAKLFHAPQHQINGWITTCDPAGINNGYVVLDWSYNLVLKNRLLPYVNQMFLPITDWKERHRFNNHDEVLNQTLSRFANNQDTGSTSQPFFGYNVGVRVYNASQSDINMANPIWEQGPWTGKEFTVRYNQNTWNQVNDLSTPLGAYRKRNSMAYQFIGYTDNQLDNYFTKVSNFIAPPVGLVLE